jgi:hypothetical protein
VTKTMAYASMVIVIARCTGSRVCVVFNSLLLPSSVILRDDPSLLLAAAAALLTTTILVDVSSVVSVKVDSVSDTTEGWSSTANRMGSGTTATLPGSPLCHGNFVNAVTASCKRSCILVKRKEQRRCDEMRCMLQCSLSPRLCHCIGSL